MDEMLFAPLSVDEARARQSIVKPDWPQPDSITAKDWSSELLWIPIDKVSGEPRASLSAYPGLSILTFDPTIIDVWGRQASPEHPGIGSVMTTNRRTGITYMPVWYMSRGESPGSWVAISGCDGITMAGDLKAHPSAVCAHLVFYLVLALFCCYWGSDIAINIINGGLDGSVSLYRSLTGHKFIPLPFAFFLGFLGIVASALIVASAYRFFPFLCRSPSAGPSRGESYCPLTLPREGSCRGLHTWPSERP